MLRSESIFAAVMARRTLVVPLALAAALATSGCGTTRWSDTARTATEQLLISDAVDRAVSQMDFAALAGQSVFVDTRYMMGATDERYLVSTLRQHLLASGCTIQEKVDDAHYVVEVRTGAVGTNRHDLLFGVPATNLPSGGFFPVAPSSIPEVPLMKRTAQQGVCKVAVFAYDRISGRPVWQSGNRQVVSRAKDVWIFGTGPFQRGTIYEGTKFAGERLEVPLASDKKSRPRPENVWVAHEIRFPTPPEAGEVAANQPASAAQPASVRPPIHVTQLSPGRALRTAPSSPPPASTATGPATFPAVPVPAPTTVPPLPPAPPGLIPGSPFQYLPPPAAPMPGAPAGAPQAQGTSSNPAGGALGAVGVYDWARSVWTGTKP